MKDIPNYKGLYAATEDGRIWSYPKLTGNGFIRPGMFLPGWKTIAGYTAHTLYDGRKRKKFLAHRLIALTFLPVVDGKDCINHKNFVRTDNGIENLEWCTRGENARHSAKHGRMTHYGFLQGETNGNSRFKESDVIDIRKRHSFGESMREIAKKFSTSHNQIGYIVKRRTWKHI